MSLINWIFDIYQHSKIDDAHRETSALRDEVAHIRSSGGGVDSARVERALGELALATKAMQRILVSKGLCTATEFADALNTIDAEDGKLDGRAPI
jgi:hypothetical protein